MISALVFAVLQAGNPYSRLADALPAGEWAAIGEHVATGTTKGLPTYVTLHATPLAVQRAAATRYASLLNALHAANEESYVPAAPLTAPDLAAVERLESLALAAAHVRFADGFRHEAVDLLLDGVTMALRVRSETAETAAIGAFTQERNGIPLAECERIRKAVDGFLIPDRKGESRTRLLLLRLRMRVEAYRWRFGILPEKLPDAAPTGETIDPRSGAPFAYEPAGDSYRLGEETKATPGGE